MDREKLERIGELSRKSRKIGLTPEEKAEQTELRNEYLAAIRKNFRAVLDNIEFTDDKK